MRALGFLTVAGLLVAVGSVSAMKLLAPGEQATASLRAVTISIQELHRQVNVRSLPESEIASLY
jgi:hypothetical protein